MKKVALLGLALVVVLSGGVALAGDKKAEHAKQELAEGQVHAAVPVTGMTCGGCCSKVETAVAKLDGGVKVKADYEAKNAMVVYETAKVDVATIVETINTKTSFKAKADEKAS